MSLEVQKRLDLDQDAQNLNSIIGSDLSVEAWRSVLAISDDVWARAIEASELAEAAESPEEQAGLSNFIIRHVRAFRGAEEYLKDINSKRLNGNPLHSTQKEAALAFYEWLRTGLLSEELMGRIIKPTGTGKTGLAVILSEMVGGKIVFIADTNPNGTQAIAEFTQHNLTLTSEKRKTVGQLFGSKAQSSADIVVTGFGSSAKWNDINWGKVRLIFVDEADVNGLSDKRVTIIKELASRYGIPVVAMSATEEQASGKKLETVYPDPIYRLPMPDSLPWCREMQIIPGVTFHDLYLEGDLEIDAQDLLRKGDIDDEVVREFAKSKDWNRKVLDHYLARFKDQRGNYQPGIVVFRDNTQVDHFISAAGYRGIKAKRFTGKESSEQLDKIQCQFQAGEIDLLAGSKLLGRGLNLPQIRVIYNCVMTYSPQLFWQVDGRGLRNEEGVGDKYVHIIAVLPARVTDKNTGRVLRSEEKPLCHAAFFDKNYFNRVHKNFVESGTGGMIPFPLSTLPIIRSIAEVSQILSAYKKRPEGFIGRPNIVARLIENIYETEFTYAFLMQIARKRRQNINAILAYLEADLETYLFELQLHLTDEPFAMSLTTDLTLADEKKLVAEMRAGIPAKIPKKQKNDEEEEKEEEVLLEDEEPTNQADSTDQIINDNESPPTPPNQETLTKALKARDALVKAHIKLIARIAEQFQTDCLEWEDLIQQGIILFIEALDYYNPKLSRARIISYAIHQVYRGLQCYVRGNEKLIRGSSYTWDTWEKMKPLIEKGYSFEEIAILLKTRPLTPLHIAQLYQPKQIVSYDPDIDFPHGGEAELVLDENPTTDELLVQAYLKNIKRTVLTRIECRMLDLRFIEEKTDTEIATEYLFTRSRSYQLRKQALDKLRKYVGKDDVFG